MDFYSYSRFFEALASEKRLKILDVLDSDDRTVSKISDILGLEQSSVSHHLNCLRNCGFVEREKNGNIRIYRSNDEILEKLFSGVAEHVSNHENGLYECEILEEK